MIEATLRIASPLKSGRRPSFKLAEVVLVNSESPSETIEILRNGTRRELLRGIPRFNSYGDEVDFVENGAVVVKLTMKEVMVNSSIYVVREG